MKWILILSMWYFNGGSSIDHIEFPTKESCEAAAEAWSHSSSGLIRNDAQCVYRG